MTTSTALSLLVFVGLLSVSWSLNQNYYSFDGSNNNVLETSWGASGSTFEDEIALEFEDGVSVPVENRPAPRLVSNLFMAGEDIISDDRSEISMFEIFFGQFVNHDIELSSVDPSKKFKIEVDDPFDFLKLVQGPNYTGFNISYSHGTTSDGQFKVLNEQTSWLDLSHVYGPSYSVSQDLRSSNGKLITEDYSVCTWNDIPPFFGGIGECTDPFYNFTDFLPSLNTTGVPTDPKLFPISESLILTAGDPRAEENIALATIHTLWLRNHNYIADMLASGNPHWSSNRIYHKARKINIAIYQHILFDEYLPAILHSSFLTPYTGYNNTVDPATSNIFATAAFRYGHSSINVFENYNEDRELINVKPDWTFFPWPNGENVMFDFGTPGPDGFTSPELLRYAQKEENILYSLIYQSQSVVDQHVSFSFRNLAAGFFPIDIASIDIARGRINGVPNYYEIRKHFYPYETDRDLYESCNETSPIDPIECFLLINDNTTYATTLQSLYGKVSNIDGIVGLLAEKKPVGHNLPPSISNIVFKEYNKKRIADRLWFENTGVFTSTQLSSIQSITLGQLLELHFDGYNTGESNPFFAIKNETGFSEAESRQTTLSIFDSIIEEPSENNSTTLQIFITVFLICMM